MSNSYGWRYKQSARMQAKHLKNLRSLTKLAWGLFNIGRAAKFAVVSITEKEPS
jgi:hypothetical protein